MGRFDAPSPAAAGTRLMLLQPRGFCAGVERAIDIVEMALYAYGAPIYVYHQIVHNDHVVADLQARGAVFVDAIDDIPVGAIAVFSAHGVSRAVVAQARARRLQVTDATCPLVAKVHQQAQRYARAGRTLVVVGHRGHDEVEGIVGSTTGPVFVVNSAIDVATLDLPAGAPLAYVTQTTLSREDVGEVIAALKARFTDLAGPGLDDICYATHNRQQAVRQMAGKIDLMLVVGARNSSNCQRLVEVAARHGMRAQLIGDDADLDPGWLQPGESVGVTAGASTPPAPVQRVVARLQSLGIDSVVEVPAAIETMRFKPREMMLRQAVSWPAAAQPPLQKAAPAARLPISTAGSTESAAP